jgi:Ras-related protein Rab-23
VLVRREGLEKKAFGGLVACHFAWEELAVMEDFEVTIKVVVLGNCKVGKSCLSKVFCKGVYDGEYVKTIGCKYLEKRNIFLGEVGDTINAMVYDVAGSGVQAEVLNGTGGALLVFSPDDSESFEALGSWKQRVEDARGDIPMAIVQTKSDLGEEDMVVPLESLKEKASRLGLPFYMVSSKEDVGSVTSLFKEILTSSFTKGLHFDEHANLSHISSNDSSGKASKEHAHAETSGAPLSSNPSSPMPAAETIQTYRSVVDGSRDPSRRRTGGKKHNACVIS